ncbi:lysophospholipid acyltransferase family protein [Pleionea sediminis]|uniref:lysophospholipid acyltransferase family protein n=1 Tax=Pleionea sediminis TaxID=2569479 RepID=UPI001186D8AD|nr:lysophospholipid acyltransferase family protein [Pleionea sediminis]
MTESNQPSTSFKLIIVIFIIRMIASLPFSVARGLGKVIGFLTWISKSRDVRVTIRNIEICYPDKDASWVKKLAKRSCIHSGMVFFESCWIWQRPNKKVADKIVDVEGFELIEQAQKNGQGLILTGPHLGNWEALLAWGGMNLPSSCMYRRPKIDALDPLIRKARSKSGVELIIGERSSVRQMLKTLKSGQCFLLLSDQNPAKNAGVFAPFFERQAYTMVLIQRLIEKTESSLLFFYAKRVKNGFKIIIEPANFTTQGLSQEEFATYLNQGLAGQINQCPEQFEWSYRRFRPQPEGIKPVYKDL